MILSIIATSGRTPANEQVRELVGMLPMDLRGLGEALADPQATVPLKDRLEAESIREWILDSFYQGDEKPPPPQVVPIRQARDDDFSQ